MKAQHEAAARVIARVYGRDFDTDATAKRAVQAADRITFSTASLIRAARAICSAAGDNDGDWVCPHHYAEAKQVADALRKKQ